MQQNVSCKYTDRSVYPQNKLSEIKGDMTTIEEGTYVDKDGIDVVVSTLHACHQIRSMSVG